MSWFVVLKVQGFPRDEKKLTSLKDSRKNTTIHRFLEDPMV